MRRRWVFIAVVLVVSVVAVCVETAVMAVWGEMQFDRWDHRSVGVYPPWPHGDNGLWPIEPRGKNVARGKLIDGDGYLAHEFGPVLSSDGPYHRYVLYTLRIGWPLRCATYEYQAEAHFQSGTSQGQINQPPSRWRHGLEVPDWLERPTSLWFNEDVRRIPICPIWRGLAANTLLHACVISALVLLPGWARRARRRAKGRCVRCGYSLAGLAAGAACPECGKCR